MANYQDDFNSLEYWRSRHNQYFTDTKGVGNAALDTAQNNLIYDSVSKYIGSLAAVLRSFGAQSVLDLGCGIGMLAHAFISNGYKYTGVDISETAINIASARAPDARFHVGNIADLSIQDQFDVIIERTVFIHLVEDEYWRSTLAQAERALSSNGVFILIDHLPKDVDSVPESASHVKFRLMHQYDHEFDKLGLKFDQVFRSQIEEYVKLGEHTHIIRRS